MATGWVRVRVECVYEGLVRGLNSTGRHADAQDEASTAVCGVQSTRVATSTSSRHAPCESRGPHKQLHRTSSCLLVPYAGRVCATGLQAAAVVCRLG
jgi:hypothetical protein